MPKVQTPARTEIQQRARLRANEEKRALHAFEVLRELMTRHIREERDLFELHRLQVVLVHAIKNQHVTHMLKAKEQARMPGLGEF